MFKKQNKIELATAFIFGIISGLILIIMYAMAIFAINSILYSTSIKEFIDVFVSSVDSGIWLILALSCLFGFLSVVMLVIRHSKLAFQKKTVNIFLFLVLLFAILASFCYHDNAVIHLLARRDAKIFLIFSVVIILIVSLYSIFLVRTSFLYIYKSVLRSLMFDTSAYIPLFGLSENENYRNMENERVFFEVLENIITYAYRNNLAVGVASFKIKNSASLIKSYGDEKYAEIEKQAAAIIKSKARIGENQCFIKDGAIFSVMHANEDTAYKALERYRKNLKTAHVVFKDAAGHEQDTEISIIMAVSGFDFSKNKPAISIEMLMEKIMWQVSNALNEAEALGTEIIYYE